MSIKIAVTYEKGGVAKTTTAVNVSAMLAERGYKVLLIDLDHQSYATSYFDMYDDSKPGVFEVMQGTVHAAKAIMETGFWKLDLLPSTYAFRGMETLLMMKTRRQEYTLQNAMKEIQGNYDFILVDCPPSGERIKTNALAFADCVILPTIPDDYAIHGLQCIAETIVDIKQGVNPSLSVLGVLITIDEHTSNKMAYKTALQQQNIFPCFKTTIRKNTTLSEAINGHKPINIYDKKCNGCKDYNELTDEILEKTGRVVHIQREA
ncbi:MAG TPA: chromosome partitioning protein ParA [Ruminococcaceae bacterium]|nr:chromosome partitioning protein ParA [Oscillospiraceae bacterium]